MSNEDVTNAARSASCGPARCSRRSASARSSTCRTCRSWSWAWRTGRSRTPWRSARSGSWPRCRKCWGSRSRRCGRPPSCRTPIRSTSSTTRPWSASRSPRSPAGWSARTAGGWPRSSSGLFELKLDPYRTDQSRYVHANCTKPGKPPTVGPGPLPRRLQERAPRRLPLGRVRPPRARPTARCELQLYELGPSGEAADIEVQCAGARLRGDPAHVRRLQR